MNDISQTLLYLKRNLISYISLFKNLDITHLGYFSHNDRFGTGITIESLNMDLEISIEILDSLKVVVNIIDKEELVKTEVIPFLEEDKDTFELLKSCVRPFAIPYK